MARGHLDERAGAFAAERADDDGRRGQRGEERLDDAGALFVVRTVDDQAAAVGKTVRLPTAGPLDRQQGRAGLGVVDGQTRREFAREHGRAGVTTLVFARQADFRQPLRESVADESERRTDGLGAGDDDRFGFGRDVADDARDARLDDARLLAGDGRVGRSEVFLVVEADRRDHADFRRADIGGVEPTAESGLEHGHVDAARGELDERRRRDQFEERRRGFRVFGADGFVMRAQRLGVGDDRGVGERRCGRPGCARRWRRGAGWL